MNRRLLIVLLALGTFGGYASGFASMARHHHSRCHGGGWGQRWDSRGESRWDDSRWDSRGPRPSWDAQGPRGAAPPVAAPSPAPVTEAPASPAEPR